jgi:arylsulfatase A
MQATSLWITDTGNYASTVRQKSCYDVTRVIGFSVVRVYGFRQRDRNIRMQDNTLTINTTGMKNNMNPTSFSLFGFCALAATWMHSCSVSNQDVVHQRPNVILINCDDLGYNEISCYGSPWPTVNIDRLAAQGTRFTLCYAGNAFCTPSRASLLTGCYAPRVGLPDVLMHRDSIGIHPDELTLGQVFQQAGYTTACVGKWHLGHLETFLPTNRGFDEFFGIPYSHDMWPKHGRQHELNFPELPLIQGVGKAGEIHDPAVLTGILTRYAVDFIRRNKTQPFFLYLPHPMPHGPLAVSEAFQDISSHGILADVITEIDWSVGQIMESLEEQGLAGNTLVIFTSDNGGPRSSSRHGPFRGGKGTTFEGGQMVPFIISWPGVIPENKVNNEIITHMDLLPTFAGLLGVTPPIKKIDGLNIHPILFGENDAPSPHERLFFFIESELQSMRSGKWKYHTPHQYLHTGWLGEPVPGKRFYDLEESLFDLETDPGERNNVIDLYPELTDSLRQIFNNWSNDFEKEKRKPGSIK